MCGVAAQRSPTSADRLHTGKMDWDETHIVFTKRSLLQMLQ